MSEMNGSEMTHMTGFTPTPILLSLLSLPALLWIVSGWWCALSECFSKTHHHLVMFVNVNFSSLSPK